MKYGTLLNGTRMENPRTLDNIEIIFTGLCIYMYIAGKKDPKFYVRKQENFPKP